jgi:hypothetical protein
MVFQRVLRANDSTQEAIKIYKADRDYPRFYRNFLIKSDNGRFSLSSLNIGKLLLLLRSSLNEDLYLHF